MFTGAASDRVGAGESSVKLRQGVLCGSNGIGGWKALQGSHCLQEKTEQNAKQSKAKQSKAKQSKAKQSKAR
jgi:hypothetical protein